MGNTPTVEYKAGQKVDARYNNNESVYYPATIIKVHEFGKYDVKFTDNGQIVTVFWDDIKATYSSPSAPSTSLSKIEFCGNKNMLSKAQAPSASSDSIKTFDYNIALNTHDSNDWHDVLKRVDFRLKNKQTVKLDIALSSQQDFDRQQMEKLEAMCACIGGETLPRDIQAPNHEQTVQYITEHILTAAKCHNSNKKANADEHKYEYLRQLKNIDIVSQNASTALQYEIVMDLDYDVLVATGDITRDAFKKQMIGELSHALRIHETLIEVEQVRKGSVVVVVTFSAVGFILFLFAAWGIRKLSFLVKKTWNTDCSGEDLQHLVVRDVVLVDWRQKEYNAVVVEKIENMNGSWIKVEYDGKPFMFKNVETLPLNSPRLHLKEPGCEYKASIYPDEGRKVSFHVEPITD
mmetsp:Transcript_56346/g.93822  ORF Transcript_56346/g.93822 Transcript_56346/m.93822 type:complete len:406 (+) Transcript_56346:34-1251(+)